MLHSVIVLLHKDELGLPRSPITNHQDFFTIHAAHHRLLERCSRPLEMIQETSACWEQTVSSNRHTQEGAVAGL